MLLPLSLHPSKIAVSSSKTLSLVRIRNVLNSLAEFDCTITRNPYHTFNEQTLSLDVFPEQICACLRSICHHCIKVLVFHFISTSILLRSFLLLYCFTLTWSCSLVGLFFFLSRVSGGSGGWLLVVRDGRGSCLGSSRICSGVILTIALMSSHF